MTNEIQREAIYRLELKRQIVRDNTNIERENIRNLTTEQLEGLRFN